MELQEPKAYGFHKHETKPLSREYACGTGGRFAMELMTRKFKDDMSDRYAMDLAQEILLYAALQDKDTGGNLHGNLFYSSLFISLNLDCSCSVN